MDEDPLPLYLENSYDPNQKTVKATNNLPVVQANTIRP